MTALTLVSASMPAYSLQISRSTRNMRRQVTCEYELFGCSCRNTTCTQVRHMSRPKPCGCAHACPAQLPRDTFANPLLDFQASAFGLLPSALPNQSK